MDAIYRDILRFEARTRRDFLIWDHVATAQDKSNDSKHQCAKAEKEALWGGWETAYVDKTGRAAAMQKSTKYSLAFH